MVARIGYSHEIDCAEKTDGAFKLAAVNVKSGSSIGTAATSNQPWRFSMIRGTSITVKILLAAATLACCFGCGTKQQRLRTAKPLAPTSDSPFSTQMASPHSEFVALTSQLQAQDQPVPRPYPAIGEAELIEPAPVPQMAESLGDLEAFALGNKSGATTNETGSGCGMGSCAVRPQTA